MTAGFSRAWHPSPGSPADDAALPAAGPIQDLSVLVNARNAAVALETDEEERALSILDGVGYRLRVPVFDWTMTRGLVRRGEHEPMYRTEDPAAALAGIIEMRTEAIYVMRDLRGQLGNVGVCRALRDVIASFDAGHHRATVVILGTAPALPTELAPCVVAYPLGLPSDAEYQEMLSQVTTALTMSRTADVALSPTDGPEVVAALKGLTLGQARQVLQQVAVEDRRLELADISRITDHKARAIGEGGVVEYVPIDASAATLGGFGRLQTWLERARIGYSAEARNLNLPAPKGILLTGVQGCGKSLAAKAVARAWALPLLRLDAGRIYDKFIGESERNVRKALQIASSLAPAVLWIDEIEKAVASGSGDSTDGGTSLRILGTLLTWMSERNDGVFIIATANDVSKLPPELLRKGRFDEMFFVDLPNGDERATILSIHMRMRKQDPDRVLTPELIVATEGFSGAELEQVVVTALLGSLQSRVPADGAAYIAEAHATVPLSRSRAEDLTRLRAFAQGRFVPVT